MKIDTRLPARYNSDMDIEIIRKNIKNMHLSVQPDGRVRVTAPYAVSRKSIEDFVRSNSSWIENKRSSLPKPVSDGQKALLKEKAAVFFSKWENLTGLECTSWQIRDMKSRWGSCSVKSKKIRLALNLANYPDECLEYVILHELAHIKIPNHSKEFKDFLTHWMPDWRERQKKLKN